MPRERKSAPEQFEMFNPAPKKGDAIPEPTHTVEDTEQGQTFRGLIKGDDPSEMYKLQPNSKPSDSKPSKRKR